MKPESPAFKSTVSRGESIIRFHKDGKCSLSNDSRAVSRLEDALKTEYCPLLLVCEKPESNK